VQVGQITRHGALQTPLARKVEAPPVKLCST
jgi:hypothetical protein